MIREAVHIIMTTDNYKHFIAIENCFTFIHAGTLLKQWAYIGLLNRAQLLRSSLSL